MKASTYQFPRQPWDWEKIGLKHQRSVDAEETKARAEIRREIEAKKREHEKPRLKLNKRGGRP